ncbi:hypothetical protein PHMEG_00030456 [Phytophthora megakarya]|uniref:Uncharacterized protein n=1 Tax=Phytophthora megakarya TaxID=4795 RepID=A0A225V0L4_9STRA|nr:hypothetical protein PHMEG_00030456 [Phytophthora megakarya]
MSLTVSQFWYIVNSVWAPRMSYHMLLGGAITVAPLVGTFIRQVARTVLRLPFSTPRNVYYDKLNGIGLDSCEVDANVHRMQEMLRILNSPDLPVYHLVVERRETYQINAGLPFNPLELPIRPPAHVRTWEAQVIRFATTPDPPLACVMKWTQPSSVLPKQSNDRRLISITTPHLRHELHRKVKWSGAKKTKVDLLYEHWRCQLVTDNSQHLAVPVGYDRVSAGAVQHQNG